MIIKKFNPKKPKVIMIQGSPRDSDSCADMISKTEKIVKYIEMAWSSYFDFEVLDLKVNSEKSPTILPCKACVSTAGGYHCHFPCSCYKKGSEKNVDYMSENDVYNKLKESDAFLIVSPIHWFALTSQVKLFFDRLVCVNKTLSVEDARNIMGDTIKDANITGQLHKSGEYDGLLKNHLEGKYCAFYAHGDDGANDYSDKDYPQSYSDVLIDPYSIDPKLSVMPYVMQMKYSGVYVPDDLVTAFHTNKGVDYYSSNLTFENNQDFLERADVLMYALYQHVTK